MSRNDDRAARRQARLARLVELGPDVTGAAGSHGVLTPPAPPAADQQRAAAPSRDRTGPPARPRPAASDEPAPDDQRPANNPVAIAPFRERLGLPDDAGPDEILAAIDARLAERRRPAADLDDAALARAGVVVVDADEFARLQAMQPAVVAAEQARQRHERAVQAAITRGAIAPARRDAWLAMLTADPGGADEFARQLDAIPDQAAVPLEPLGHAYTDADTHHDVRQSDPYTHWKV